MSAIYKCPYCGYEMDRMEMEQSVDEGCPSCRQMVPEQPYKCESDGCENEIEEGRFYCDFCLMGEHVDDRISERINNE
jgi:hypothetical protein